MPRKRFTAEQIIPKLREAEVEQAKGRMSVIQLKGRSGIDWRPESAYGASHAMNRKEFLECSKAVIGGFALQAGFSEVGSAPLLAKDNDNRDRERDDYYYVVKGLTGMARAGGWFDAHWGAAVLAGDYLCRENQLGDETTTAIRKQLDAMIKLRAEQFTPFPEEPSDKALIDEVPKALVPAIQGGLRAHGHAVIFASLSVRALRDVPHIATPKLIQSLCDLSRQIARQKPQKPDGEPSYANTHHSDAREVQPPPRPGRTGGERDWTGAGTALPIGPGIMPDIHVMPT